MKKYFNSIAFSLIFAAQAYAAPAPAMVGVLPKDIQYVRKSAEYKALCVQIYGAAARAVKELAAKEKKPNADVVCAKSEGVPRRVMVCATASRKASLDARISKKRFMT